LNRTSGDGNWRGLHGAAGKKSALNGSDQDLEVLRQVVANKPDSEICDALVQNGMARAEAEYAVAAARQRMNDLVRQAQARVKENTSAYTVAQQLGAETSLPLDLAEQIVARAHVQTETAHKRDRSAKLSGRAKAVAAVIGIAVGVIYVVHQVMSQSNQVSINSQSDSSNSPNVGTAAYLVGLVAAGVVYVLVLGVLRLYEASKRRISDR
jgi:hypothetical protein